jgi:hypothetical protein
VSEPEAKPLAELPHALVITPLTQARGNGYLARHPIFFFSAQVFLF